MSESTPTQTVGAPPHRYTARLAGEIEAKWQARWERDKVFHAPNPTGDLSDGFERLADAPKLFVLDMFPYPSGVGLHVGHPLGYIATDIFARYKRMTGHNVLHAMGYDAFGLPAEQFAVQSGTHPRITTENNINAMRRQLTRLGLAHDERRSVATTDAPFYKWTQWIFLQIYNAWYDQERDAARPIDELVREFESGARAPLGEANPDGKPWSDLNEPTRRRIVDSHRLVYLDEQPVNWCPALGTVLANEEVTPEGRSERGNHPVFRRPLKQWVMRITAYAERLLRDLDLVTWPEPVKLMQRNWIGRSEGARIDFPIVGRGDESIRVFTTRPDTVFGATYMVLAPEHPMVDPLTRDHWPPETKDAWKGGAHASPSAAVNAYRAAAAAKSDVQRLAETKEKTGVFTGSSALNPATGARIPIFIADYVLMGYGTGAIMAVPGQDERDWDFAEAMDLPIVRTVQPPEDFDGKAYTGEGPAINSEFLDGLRIADAKREIITWLEREGAGQAAVQYKLRDWLFSRQRYWGEPFPIVYDEHDMPRALPESELPVTLPELDDFAPEASDDPEAPPKPPLARAREWAQVELDLGEGRRTYRREVNTMPQWAGSCWYYLRYLDPTNDERFCDPKIERYWMQGGASTARKGGVDLYVGGVEHAVLHLLYARFWHKVLYDLGHVSTVEPFDTLFNQGYIQGPAYTDSRGVYVEASEVEERGGEFFHKGEPVRREFGKIGKSLKNAVSPDEICNDYGADTLRLYEMYMGPLDQSKPWNPRDIIGMHRFLQKVWRNIIDEVSGELRISEEAPADHTRRIMHKTIAGVRDDCEELAFNTAIAKLNEFNNHLTQAGAERCVPREAAETLVNMLAPFTPHIADELWERLGRGGPLIREPFPQADESMLVEDEVELAVQVLGKVRARITVPADADEKTIENRALSDDAVKPYLEGKTVRKVIVVPGRLVNIVAT